LWRAQKSPAAIGVNPFTDVAADAYYVDAVLWAVEEKVTNGTSATTFSPDADCTRAQIVTFLYRALSDEE
ncbi:MAG: S-layer homology domain-containing protein, partial [Clostridia bacterium]|nr:S-layer homology domain-containing protein [Clostridia bacterium]